MYVIFTYELRIYHKHQPNVGIDMTYTDGMGYYSEKEQILLLKKAMVFGKLHTFRQRQMTNLYSLKLICLPLNAMVWVTFAFPF